MIGSALGRIAMADKMSVEQLKEALQNKTLPAYIAIPLIEEKMDMKDRMTRSQAAQGIAQQPPIAEEVLARTEPDMGPGIESLPTGLPAQGMAGGGIVAFADGGDVIRANNGLPKEMLVNPYLADYIRRMETGGLRNPDIAVSPKGAVGRMQIMPDTAMKPGFNVPTIFDLADRMGIGYESRTTDEAKRLLTNPNLNVAFGERYAGAMQSRFGDNPMLAAAAFNAGPGAVERAGGVPDIAETKKYVAGISPERFEAARQSMQDARRGQVADIKEALTGSVPPGLGSTFDPYLEATKPTTAAGPRDATQDFVDYLRGDKPIPVRGQDAELMREAPPPAMGGKAVAPTATTEAATPVAKAEEDSDIAALRKSIAARRAELGKQRQEDRAMALLAAGLGMMSGTSPRALENIGKGALQGLEYARGSRKEQREAEQDILASELGLSRATLYEKMRQDQLASSKEMAQAKNAISQQIADLRKQQGYRDAVDMWNNSPNRAVIEDALKKEYGKNWQQDGKATLRLQAERNKFIQDLLRAGSAAGVSSYDQLMAR